jgi:arylsulfatase A-like enzyme
VNTDALIATIDLMPTILDLCDIPVPDSLDGKSFKDQCYGEDRGHFQELYSVNRDSRMLRFGQYKYIHSEVYGQEYEILFDLWADPDETTNVFGQDGYEAVSSEARQRLDAWLQRQNLSLTFDSI